MDHMEVDHGAVVGAYALDETQVAGGGINVAIVNQFFDTSRISICGGKVQTKSNSRNINCSSDCRLMTFIAYLLLDRKIINGDDDSQSIHLNRALSGRIFEELQMLSPES